MQLLIDAGNTRIKWGVADSSRIGDWHATGVVKHAEIDALKNHCGHYPIDSVLVSNVAGDKLFADLVAVVRAALLGARLRRFTPVTAIAGVHSHYGNVNHIGTDRLASLIGAHYLFPDQALIVATCGTATTIDNLCAKGHFRGGMILPGLSMMGSALAQNTALLPNVQQFTEVSTFANNTHDAIVSGCVSAHIGAIAYACDVFERQQGPILCVLAGGAAGLIAPHLQIPYRILDNLVLLGMWVAADENHRDIPC